jgi:hypothetical protein
MVAHVYTVAFQGIEPREVDVQVHVSNNTSINNPFSIVGLADKAVAESRERVRAALSAIGLALPHTKITINLAPADLPKEGSHYDLPIALGLLAAMGVLPASEMAHYTAMGELSLDAQITSVAGVLPTALAASEAGRGLICPAACGPEAAWAGGLEIIAAPSLISIVNHMKGVQVLNPPTAKIAEEALLRARRVCVFIHTFQIRDRTVTRVYSCGSRQHLKLVRLGFCQRLNFRADLFGRPLDLARNVTDAWLFDLQPEFAGNARNKRAEFVVRHMPYVLEVRAMQAPRGVLKRAFLAA